MPIASRMVYATSAGAAGRCVVNAPCRSVRPSTKPGFTPAPANSSDAACPQWSRPASLVIFGVANSPITTSSVSANVQQACISSCADTAVSNSGSLRSGPSKMRPWWSQPP